MRFASALKKPVINLPLLVALLITSIVHLGLILSIEIMFSKNPPQENSIEISLVKLKPTPRPPRKKVRKTKVIQKTTPIPPVKSHDNPDAVSNPKPKKNSLPKNSHSPSNKAQKLTKSQKKSPTQKPISTVAVTTVVDPTSTPQVETPATSAVATDIAMPPVTPTVEPDAVDNIDKPLPVPTKTTQKPTKKTVKKTAKIVKTDNAESVFSMDDLAAQIAQAGEKFGNLPPVTSGETRIKPLNSVRKHKASAQQYKQDWRSKIERIANLNYPEAARQPDFSARLVLEVGINADGSLHSLKIKKSSGTPALDEAAKNIVQMGAPFAALPKDLAEELDVLILQQPMQFSDESGATVQ